MSSESAISDRLHRRFLERQVAEGHELAESSDLLELTVQEPGPPHFVITLHCRGLVRMPEGAIEEANCFQAGVWFPPDYLRRVDPFDVLRWFGPQNIWHPNISDTLPLICMGRLAPGTSLTEIIYQLFEIITFNKYTPREDDCLNKACCSWARENQHLFPVDRRPLKRRTLNLEVSQS